MYQYYPKVSIVIPAYNASNYLAEAIDSALAQTYKNVEVIVINDGSDDEGATRRLAQSYGNKIRYLEKKNGGSSSALNMGIDNMAGEWFSWLSHDDLYYPEKVEQQIACINRMNFNDENIKNNVFFTAYELIDSKGKIIRRPKESEVVAEANRVNNVSGNEVLIAEPMRNVFHGCSCLVHRDVFSVVGKFDEDLRLVNDVDFWFRVYAAGYKIHLLPQILVKGRIHMQQVSKSIGYSYQNEEQDKVWSFCLTWLKNNFPERYELFYLYGRNAYLKTRTEDGDRAFTIAVTLEPDKKEKLFLKKMTYCFVANVKSVGKKIYMKFR